MNRLPKMFSVFRILPVFTVLLTSFILCYEAGPLAPKILVPLAMLIGASMAGLVIVRWVQTGIRIPLEVGILCFFIAWATGSGLLQATDANQLKDGIERMVQVVLLVGCVSSMAAISRTPSTSFVAISALALILAGYSLFTGEFAAASEIAVRHGRIVGDRATSLTSNPNSLGVICAWAFVGMAFFWPVLNRIWMRILMLAIWVLLLAGVVYSGSRKAVLLAPIFLAAWAWFCYRDRIFKGATTFLCLVGVTVVMAYGVWYVAEDTFAGYRLERAVAVGNRDSSTNTRLNMIRDGIQMVAERPLVGVGLYQYAPQSYYDKYAHNDYVEVAATTGIVGFLVYYSIFLLTAWRLVSVRRLFLGTEMWYAVGICEAALVTCAAAGFALVMYSNIVFWCFVSPIIGFAYAVERDASRWRNHAPDLRLVPVWTQNKEFARSD